MLPVAATSLHSFSRVPLVIRRGQQKTNCALVHEWRPEGSHFCFANWPWQLFLPWTWNWYKIRETCKWNVKFRSELSSRGKRAYLFRFSIFLGIFQWDEPKKRFPLTAEPKFPEIFTKWKAIGSREPVVSLVRYKLGRVVLGRGDENDSQSHRRSEARERNTCYGASKLWWHRWTKACSKSSWQTKNETALI